MVAPLPILKFYLVQDRPCDKPPNGLGNHRRQSQQSRLELGLRLSRGFRGANNLFIVRADEKLTAFVELERAIHDFAVSLILIIARQRNSRG
jgi:hypothetical protein